MPQVLHTNDFRQYLKQIKSSVRWKTPEGNKNPIDLTSLTHAWILLLGRTNALRHPSTKFYDPEQEHTKRTRALTSTTF